MDLEDNTSSDPAIFTDRSYRKTAGNNATVIRYSDRTSRVAVVIGALIFTGVLCTVSAIFLLKLLPELSLQTQALEVTAPLCGRWQNQTTPNFTQIDNLNGLAALANDDVWVVGSGHDAGTDRYGRTVIMHWDGTRLQEVESPSPDASEL